MIQRICQNSRIFKYVYWQFIVTQNDKLWHRCRERTLKHKIPKNMNNTTDNTTGSDCPAAPCSAFTDEQAHHIANPFFPFTYRLSSVFSTLGKKANS